MGIGATVALIKALAPATDQTEIEQIEQDVSDLKNDIQGLKPAATNEDIGKAIIVKTVENGVPTSYEYGNTGSDDPAVIEQKVDAWLDENITNPSNPPLDKSLSVNSAAAPSGVVGTTIKAFTEATKNLFNPVGVVIGIGKSGSESAIRGVSARMYVGAGNKYTIKAKTLPANLKYMICEYTGTAVSTYAADKVNWVSDGSANTVTATYDYVGLLFGTVNNANMTESDFTGIELQCEVGIIATDYVTCYSAVDLKAREDNAENAKTMAVIETKTRNIFTAEGAVLGYGASGLEDEDRGYSIAFNVGSGNLYTVKAKTIPSNLKYGICHYSNSDISSFHDWRLSLTMDTDAHSFTETTYPYIRIIFATVDGNDLTAEDLEGLELQVEIGSETPYVPHETAVDAIAREMVSSGAVEFRLMEYNIGHYCYGTGSTVADIGLPAESYNQAVADMKAFFAKYHPNILGMCEFWQYLDNAKTHTSDDVLFDPIYPHKFGSDIWNAIKSDYAMSHKEYGALTAKDDKGYYKATFNVNGKSVTGMVVHFPIVNADASDRQAAMSAAITLLAGYENAFICGDFNCDTTSERDALFAIATAAGYTLANGGYFGWHMTYNYQTQVSYLDNILVKGNIKVKDFKVLTSEVGNLYSDHIPIYADLLVY